MLNSIEKYTFTDDGKIIDNGIIVEIVNGYVNLDLTFGGIRALAGKLFIIARASTLDLDSYHHIQIFYNDGDDNNYCRDNIEYFFSPAIECPSNKGFFIIPGFTNYGISRSGELINRKTKRIKKWTISKGNETTNTTGGYRIAGGNSDENKYDNLKRHRIFGLVFFPPSTNPRKLWINHIDGIPGNDDFDNLEWVTPGNNIKHAYRTGLCTSALFPVITRDINTGELKHYQSIAVCAEELNLNYVNLNRWVHNPEISYVGLQFKKNDGNDWPNLKRISKGKSEELSVVARNVFTGEQFIFNSIVEATAFTNCDQASISVHANTKRIVPMREWNFRLAGDDEGFPNHCNINLNTFKQFPGKSPMAIVSESGDISFSNINFFANHYGFSRGIAANKINNCIPVNGVVYKYLRHSDNLGNPIKLKCSNDVPNDSNII